MPPMLGGVEKLKLVIASFPKEFLPFLIPLSAWCWTVGQSALDMSYKCSQTIKFQHIIYSVHHGNFWNILVTQFRPMIYK